MIDVYEELKRIINALNDNEIEYAVCGGWAMAIHGVARATIDIDLLISADSLEKVFDIAKLNDYWLEGLPMTFNNGQTEIRRISKIDDETGFVLMLDLLLVTPELTDVWREKLTKPLENGAVSVVSRKGLIKMKTMSGRTQDLADIEKLTEIENED
ncbi:MAG TPA: hypothetical protein PKY59_22470 [Pyrinomonadaceae bacterium]|nr:hypothetical protein [Pyrinomonadaceae bacterium]